MSGHHIVHLENGRLADDTPHTEVEKMVTSAIESNPLGGLAVHFHGGLVSQDKALELAKRLEPIYEEGEAYPIFFVWESGLLETIQNNFKELANEKLFRILLKRVLKIVVRKSVQAPGTRGVGTLPDVDRYDDDLAIDAALDARDDKLMPEEPVMPDDLDEISTAEENALVAELELDMPLRNELGAVTNGLREESDITADVSSRAASVRASTQTLMSPDAVERILERPDAGSRGVISILKAAKAIVSIASSVIGRLLDDRDHGVHATVVEEILREFYVANVGEVIWSAMKKDTADSFLPGHETYGGTAFLDDLKKAAESGMPLPKITLIGHSTGAVYICHLLEAADKMHLPPNIGFDIVFLAPASTFSLTSKALDEHSSRIRNFRMFTMTDDNERKDALVPVIYPHSLLYFVSGVVEKDADTPIIGMQRYFKNSRYDSDEFVGISAMRKFVAEGTDRAVWSITNDGPGLKTQALKHGEFDNDEDTLASVKHILAAGF